MRKPAIYCAILICSIVNVFGQNADSLKHLLSGTSGKERVDILHELIINVWHNYPAQAMSYGTEALEISRKIQDSIYISKSLRLIAGVHYYKGDFENSLEYNLKALEMGEALNDSTLINNGYNNIGLLYYNLGSYQIALEYLLRSLDIKRRRNETYGYSTTLNNVCLLYTSPSPRDRQKSRMPSSA